MQISFAIIAEIAVNQDLMMLHRLLQQPFLWLTITSLAVLTACTEDVDTVTSQDNKGERQSTLEQVKERGSLICGVNGQLPGFSFVDENGEYTGLDADFCRAIAAAIFDDPDAIQFLDLSAQERLKVVQQGEVDVLSRNTTWTTQRDTTVGLDFAPTLFYDGQGILVSPKSRVETLADLEGKSICVQSGTTTELNLADHMRKNSITYKPVIFDDAGDMYRAYASGRCDGATSDRSQLVVQRANMDNPADHILLPEVLSKEPLSPAIKSGDNQWFDIVKWLAYTLIQAEEFGVTSDNLSEFIDSKDPRIRRFLGQEGQLGEDLGLSKDFAVRVIKHVGNYGEIYERNLGEPFDLDRGINSLWTEDGLLYAPPFR